MNKITLLISLSLVLIFSSCKDKNPKSNTDKKNTTEKLYYLNNFRSNINWTAYKTSDKIPVNGKFKEVNVIQNGGKTISEALDGLVFEIPISSIFTNNQDRDYKLKNIFFGKLIDSAVLKGKINVKSVNDGEFSLTMNGITKSFPFSMDVIGNKVDFVSQIKLSKWQTELAVKAINEACYELHKGPDGVSMIWDEVDLKITSFFDEK